MVKAAQKLHGLTKLRKELVTLLKKKDACLDHSISTSLNNMREAERKKRIELYGEVEEQRQQLTSALMQELMQICDKEPVPRYIVAIAKVLDNYQGNIFFFLQFFLPVLNKYTSIYSGGINSVRSNSNWISEILTQLTDHMRNFESGQSKLDAKYNLILEKVNKFKS